MLDATPDTLASDRLDGVPAIAAFLGYTERRTRYLISIRAVPVGRQGNRYVASKRALTEHWQKLTGGKAAAPAGSEAT